MNRHPWLVLLSLCLASTLAAQPRLSLERTDIDLGVIYRGDTKKTSFTLKNVGNEPLKILQVVPSCGCTALKRPKEVLQPGEEEIVEVEFSSATFRGRVESKRVDILTNDPLAEYATVKLSADVREELAPETGTSLLWFGSVRLGTEAVQRITFRNITDKPITITATKSSAPRIKVTTSKKRLAPDDTVDITVQLTADKEGYTPDHIELRTDSKNQSVVTINVSFIGLKGS